MRAGFAVDAARSATIVAVAAVAGLSFNAWRTDGVALSRAHSLSQGERAELLADGFVVVDTARAEALFAEAAEFPGFVVFLDARNDELFGAGHVTGALQLDFYRLHEQLAAVRPALHAATQVVVYCGSEECDDALLLCRALRDTYALPGDKLLVYRGGLRAWQGRGLPTERGGR